MKSRRAAQFFMIASTVVLVSESLETPLLLGLQWRYAPLWKALDKLGWILMSASTSGHFRLPKINYSIFDIILAFLLSFDSFYTSIIWLWMLFNLERSSGERSQRPSDHFELILIRKNCWIRSINPWKYLKLEYKLSLFSLLSKSFEKSKVSSCGHR